MVEKAVVILVLFQTVSGQRVKRSYGKDSAAIMYLPLGGAITNECAPAGLDNNIYMELVGYTTSGVFTYLQSVLSYWGF